jgi:hypothetical protein
MRAFVLAIGLWLAGLAPAAADGPFSPTANVPDHVVTLIERNSPGRGGVTRTVYSHRDWTRVDTKSGGYTSSSYRQRDCKASVQFFPGSNSEARTLVIRRGCDRSLPYDYTPFRTDEQQSIAGERCSVWGTHRSKASAGFTLEYTSCVTDDGIELWSKATGRRGDVVAFVEATAVERIPVAPADVYPPADLLKIDGWFTEAADRSDPGRPDFEVVMQREGGAATTRTVRRRGHWIYEEETSGGVLKTVSINNSARGLGFAVRDLDTDKPALTLSTLSQADIAEIAAAVAQNPMKPKALGRHEVVLGERCEWFDMTPGMADASYGACRTGDGITLKDIRSGRGREDRTDVAIRLTRRPIALDEIKPPPALLDRTTWGLPD